MVAFSVMISLIVGLVVGCASMAMWAARRIGDEAARQFDRGFERGRWLADVSATGGLEPLRRSHRGLILPGGSPGDPGPDTHDPPTLLKPQRFSTPEPGTHGDRSLADH
jgi:hypothetical protein